MRRNRAEPPAVRVYTVCDESKYLIVRNVPALGCGDELLKLFGTYGEVEECKPMDAEDCELFTDVYWVKFHQVNNARFAKRKLDEIVFLGNKLQVSYAPQFESLSDTKEKLEGRRREVIGRLNPRHKVHTDQTSAALDDHLLASNVSQSIDSSQRGTGVAEHPSSISMVSSDNDYFSSQSMNQTVRTVRDKLNKIKSSGEQVEAGSAKRTRVDNRRRI